MVPQSSDLAPPVSERPGGDALYESYATAAASLVLRVSHDFGFSTGRVAVGVAASDDDCLHVEVLPGYLCHDAVAGTKLSATQTGDHLVVEVRVLLSRDQGDRDQASLVEPPPAVHFLVPPRLVGLSLECGRGPVAVDAPDCERLTLLTVAGDVSLGHCGGFVAASVGTGSLHLANADGEANCSIGSGSIEADSCRGRVRLSTGSGQILAHGFVGSVLSAEAGEGTVSVAASLAESLTVSVRQGHVAVSDVSTAAMSVVVGTGRCVCSGDLADGTHSLAVERGDLTIEVPDDSPLRFDLATGAGEIACPLPSVQVGRRGRPSSRGQRLVGVKGAGTVHLNVSVGRGNIDLRLAETGA